jgi:gluconokinase
MILIVAGVAGSGKTTVGELVAAELNWEFDDGDGFHSAAAVTKMKSGTPLTDADRRPWLAAIGAWLDAKAASGQRAVLACSAIKRAYRDELLTGRDQVRMVFLAIEPAAAASRLRHRRGHFFGAGLVNTQFAELESPGPDEPVLVLAADQSPTQLAHEITARLGLR